MNATHRLTFERDGQAITAEELDTFVRSWPDEARASDLAIEVGLPGVDEGVTRPVEVQVTSVAVTWLEDL